MAGPIRVQGRSGIHSEAWRDPMNPRQRQNRRSRQQEQKHAKQTGGRRVAGSGSSWRAPGDTKDEEFLYELKYTDKDSFRLTRFMIEDHYRKSLLCGKEPRIIVEFTDGPTVMILPWEG